MELFEGNVVREKKVKITLLKIVPPRTDDPFIGSYNMHRIHSTISA